MTASFDAANFIPGNDVAEAFGYLQVAVWADPGFSVVCVCANARLSGVLDAAFEFGSSNA
jgi:hypothetical protein